MSYYRQQLHEWLADKHLIGEAVLSVGCQEDDRKYFEKVDVQHFLTADIDKDKNPNIVMDFNEYYQLDDWRGDFDHILSFELWEYIWNPVQALLNMNEMLKSDGLLWISAPFLYPVHNPVEMDYLRYTQNGFHRLLEKTGFMVADYERRVFKDPQGWFSSVAADKMKPAKEFAYHNTTGHFIIAQKVR